MANVQMDQGHVQCRRLHHGGLLVAPKDWSLFLCVLPSALDLGPCQKYLESWTAKRWELSFWQWLVYGTVTACRIRSSRNV